jgi:hypothetical protein
MSSLNPTEFELKHSNEVELAKRELSRRSLDTIRIYNPLDKVFSYMFDGYWHRVPAKSYDDIYRYLANHFFKKICDYMINEQISLKGAELKELREKQMGRQFLDHYDENVEVWNKVPRKDDEQLIAQIKKTVVIGLVREYGLDLPPELEKQNIPSTDFRPVHERMLDEIERIPDDKTINNMMGRNDKPEIPIYVSKKEQERLDKLKLEQEATNE